MTSRHFDIFVSYSQVAVFTAGLDAPFNDWEPLHIAQGFAWRPESVSFKTPGEAGVLHCEAAFVIFWQPSPEAQQAIRVPFTVTGGRVEIASISDGAVVELGGAGTLALIFESWMGADGDMRARFTFAPQETPVVPAILKTASGQQPSVELLMTARPAR